MGMGQSPLPPTGLCFLFAFAARPIQNSLVCNIDPAMSEDRLNLEREWTTTHVFTYFYNAFAYGSDGILSSDEKREIVACIKEWMTDISDEELFETLDETLVWIGEDLKESENGDKVFENMGNIVSILDDMLKPNNGDVDRRKYFLCDLVRLSVADGNFDDTEKAWIRETADRFGINFRI
jgi:hypothetical protein